MLERDPQPPVTLPSHTTEGADHTTALLQLHPPHVRLPLEGTSRAPANSPRSSRGDQPSRGHARCWWSPNYMCCAGLLPDVPCHLASFLKGHLCLRTSHERRLANGLCQPPPHHGCSRSERVGVQGASSLSPLVTTAHLQWMQRGTLSSGW